MKRRKYLFYRESKISAIKATEMRPKLGNTILHTTWQTCDIETCDHFFELVIIFWTCDNPSLLEFGHQGMCYRLSNGHTWKTTNWNTGVLSLLQGRPWRRMHSTCADTLALATTQHTTNSAECFSDNKQLTGTVYFAIQGHRVGIYTVNIYLTRYSEHIPHE